MRIIFAFLIVFLFPLCGKAQWTKCNGPYGGNMDFIAQNKATQTLFAGSTSAGLYRYNQTVGKWESLLNHFPVPQITGLVCADSAVYVSDYFGLYKSSDDGNTWDTVMVSSYPSNFFGTLRTDGHNILISANNDSIYISHDGNTFTPFGFSVYNLDITVISTRLIQSSFINNTSYGTGTINMAYSDDQGQSWQSIFVDSLANYFIAISSISIQAYLNNFYVFVNGQAQYVSADSGLSWSRITCQNLPFCGQSVNQLLQSTTGLWIAGQSGVSEYSNGAWQITNSGLTIFPVNGVCRDINNLVVCLNNSILFSSSDDGNTWNPVGLQGIPTYYPIDIQGITNIGKRIILTTGYLGTAYSDDGGIAWIDSLDNGSLSEPIVAGGRIYALSYAPIAASDDSGLDWYLVSSGVNVNNLNCQVQNIAANTQSVVATEFCTNNSIIGNVSEYALIYSTDSGATFHASNFPGGYCANVAVLGAKAFAIGSALFKSDDKGADWYIDSGYNQNTYTAVYTIEPNFVLLGTQTGHILFSSDTGNTFADITSNFTAIPRGFYNLGTKLYVISSEQGIWKTDATQYGIPDNTIATSAQGTDVLSLYPNPSRNILNVVLPVAPNPSAPVTIKIYDLLGQEVFSEMTTGSAVCTISTTNFSRGVYVMKLTGIGPTMAAKFVID